LTTSAGEAGVEYDEGMRYLVGDDLPILASRPGLPAVCIDIDGVLNPMGPDNMAGFSRHRVLVPKEDLPHGSPFLLGHGREDLDLWVHASQEHGRWLTALRQRADIYWATTWETAANLHFAPLIGLAPLPTIPHSLWLPTLSDIKHGESGRWKRYALNDLFAGRPLVWIDDCALDDDIKRWRGESPTLVIIPDEEAGLTRAQMQKVDWFVAKQSIGMVQESPDSSLER